MVPEYSKVALGLYPLIPTYAVNCHAEKNKRFCADQVLVYFISNTSPPALTSNVQGVQGFPTVKLFPRGNSMPPVLYEQERTATGFWYFATRGIPNALEKFSYVYQIPGWVSGVRIHNYFLVKFTIHISHIISAIIQKKHKYRALLLTKDKKVPLLWRVLANKYSGTDILFATHRDRKGRSSVEMGLEVGGKKDAKVLFYPIGSETPFRYRGPFASSSHPFNMNLTLLKQASSNKIHSLNSLTPSSMAPLISPRSLRRLKTTSTLRTPKRLRSPRSKKHSV